MKFQEQLNYEISNILIGSDDFVSNYCIDETARRDGWSQTDSEFNTTTDRCISPITVYLLLQILVTFSHSGNF